MDDQKNSTLAGTLSEGDYSEKKQIAGAASWALRKRPFELKVSGRLVHSNSSMLPVKFGDFFPRHQDATHYLGSQIDGWIEK